MIHEGNQFPVILPLWKMSYCCLAGNQGKNVQQKNIKILSTLAYPGAHPVQPKIKNQLGDTGTANLLPSDPV